MPLKNINTTIHLDVRKRFYNNSKLLERFNAMALWEGNNRRSATV